MADKLSTEESLSAPEWLACTRDLERRGEFLRAYDTAVKGLQQHPQDTLLQYRSVLVLARTGATELAVQRYADFNLENNPSEDIAALGARLSKDRALRENGEKRAAMAASAAAQYETTFTRTGGHYPGINAATLYRVAGDITRARELAQQVIDALDKLGPGEGDEHYYRLASRAEALLLLEQGSEIREVLAQAFETVNGDWAALAATRRQLRLVCQVSGQDVSLLDSLQTPTVIHFCGHVIAASGTTGRFLCDDEKAIASKIAEYLQQFPSVIGFGSLAAGADILIAEALLARGGELHVALPFCLEEFVDISVRPSGEAWVERFHRCLSAAQSVRYATEDGYLGDDQLFTYCSGLAMGLAVHRARYLDGSITQLAVWDGEPPKAPVGTAFDVSCWRDLGLTQTTIPVTGKQLESTTNHSAPSRQASDKKSGNTSATPLVRVQRAMLFGDVKGFSKLGDQQLPAFINQILGRMAKVIDSFGDKVSFKNTWGDGLFVVFENVRDAAQCALAMQQAMGELQGGEGDLSDPQKGEHNLPPQMALRLGCHYGPVYCTRDPILKVDNYFGAHVSRTARIEPVTPEGCVYVTEPFTAMLALDNLQSPGDENHFACDYVGNIPAAKGYGDLSMYLLKASTH